MNRRDKTSTAKTDAIVLKAVDFEITIADIARRSERRAWWTAFSAILMALILASGYFLMLPLKEKVPYLVMADAYTGTSTVAKLRWDFNANSIFSSEAINKSNVSHFVVARESFDRADAIRSRDWVTVNAMAAPDVRSEYRNLFNRANPTNFFTIYQKNEVVRVNLISLQLSGAKELQVGKNATPSFATVRFQRVLFNKENGVSRVLDTNVAAVQFVYRDDLGMDDKLRTENPLGFWVTGYRVDKELSSSPPPSQMEEAQVMPDTETSTQASPAPPGSQPGVVDSSTPATTMPN